MRCLGCRLRHKMSWTGRLMLEAQSHYHSRMLTLTYSDETRPSGLVYKHVQDFLKLYGHEVRKWDPDRKQRFFVVGELGEKTAHAHWHLVLFGERSLQPDWMTKALYVELPGWTDKWGFASDMQLNERTAAYVCGYTLKKAENDKPFARMSLRPGIAFPALDAKAAQLYRKMGSRPAPVPQMMGVGGKNYPVSDGLRRRWIKVYIELGGIPLVKDARDMDLEAADYIRFHYGTDAHGQEKAAQAQQERFRVYGTPLPPVRKKDRI